MHLCFCFGVSGMGKGEEGDGQWGRGHRFHSWGLDLQLIPMITMHLLFTNVFIRENMAKEGKEGRIRQTVHPW